jgi:hypothetical protein
MTTQRTGRRALERCPGWLAWLCRLWMVITCGRKGGDECVYIPEQIINRPDPCIYDQFLLMQLGLPVTWDDPDVAIFLGGVEQYTYDLTADTVYDLNISVHNSSREKPAFGRPVAAQAAKHGSSVPEFLTGEPLVDEVHDCREHGIEGPRARAWAPERGNKSGGRAQGLLRSVEAPHDLPGLRLDLVQDRHRWQVLTAP